MTNIYDLYSYSRGNGAFSDLGGGTVCLGKIVYFLQLQFQVAAQLPLLRSWTQGHGYG